MPLLCGQKRYIHHITLHIALSTPLASFCTEEGNALTALIKNTPRREEMCAPAFHFAAIMLKYKLEEVEPETAPRESEE